MLNSELPHRKIDLFNSDEGFKSLSLIYTSENIASTISHNTYPLVKVDSHHSSLHSAAIFAPDIQNFVYYFLKADFLGLYQANSNWNWDDILCIEDINLIF